VLPHLKPYFQMVIAPHKILPTKINLNLVGIHHEATNEL